MSEETSKQKQASAIVGSDTMKGTADSEFMNEVEKKWQAKEVALTAENERILGQARERDDSIRCTLSHPTNLYSPQSKGRRIAESTVST
jgi:hypothetical protein